MCIDTDLKAVLVTEGQTSYITVQNLQGHCIDMYIYI